MIVALRQPDPAPASEQLAPPFAVDAAPPPAAANDIAAPVPVIDGEGDASATTPTER
jgi:hypothetical protein